MNFWEVQWDTIQLIRKDVTKLYIFFLFKLPSKNNVKFCQFCQNFYQYFMNFSEENIKTEFTQNGKAI